MGFPTDEQQEEILKWWALQSQRESTTAKIGKGIIHALQELHIVEKLDISVENAHKAWVTTQKLERAQRRRNEADLRAASASLNTLKANLTED